MTAIAADRRRRAVTYVVLIALGVVYAASLAIFARAERRPAGMPRADTAPPVPIVLSVPMRVGEGGCGECRRSGWGAPAPDWTWTTKETATLIFSAPTAPELDMRELILDIDAVAFFPRALRRTLVVSIGGEVVGEAEFLPTDPMNGAFFAGGHSVHSFRLPGRLVTAAPTLLIELRMASAGSPRQHFISPDPHEFGVAVRSVSLRIAE
jgi:hypothetical protein